MERLLLSFYNLNLTAFHQSEVSNILDVSQKHLSRSLNRWQEDGILSYVSARGRGNKTTVEWHMNIDQMYFDKVIQLITPYQLSDAIQYLTWDWSLEHKQILITKANQLLGISPEKQDKLIVRKRYAPLFEHPLEVLDINSSNILSNVYDTLMTYNRSRHSYQFKIAQHIDFQTDYAMIYLRKNVSFHDGTQVTSEDVKRCLLSAKVHQELKVLLSPITDIEVIQPYILKVHYQHYPHFKDVLCKLNLAIYKQGNNRIIGTGPFYISENNDFQTVLKAFEQYYGYRAYLDEVELIYIPKLKQSDYTIDVNESSNAVNHIQVTDGFYYVLSLRQSTLTATQKATIHHLLQQSVHHIDDPHTGMNTAYILEEQALTMNSPKHLETSFSITIIYPSYIEKKMLQIKRYLHQFDIEAVLKPIDIMTSFNSEIKMDGDLYIHGMYFTEADSFEYFTLLYQNTMMHYHLSNQFDALNAYYHQYLSSDTTHWDDMNHTINRHLFDAHLLYPIFNIIREVQVPKKIHNAHVTSSGFYNFAELVVKQ
ncbi:ABC transporter substrate-binding protein [Macrococcoides caseolyticum]|uniref:ABC transporter substrate-binding protein n=1 Tax=Macrococcoides caseolyticum TaxID=69966 RepID=UPI001F369161|nr:ABC transporter substrate-binding protein [Macrococcus caseolyticus]MCE4956977.1 SgrR family transcriptional regulator [Macrococcus caseolyticus]